MRFEFGIYADALNQPGSLVAIKKCSYPLSGILYLFYTVQNAKAVRFPLLKEAAVRWRLTQINLSRDEAAVVLDRYRIPASIYKRNASVLGKLTL